ncbi:hypothetical protein D3OALGA1CA_3442 [Olavius algarvensis associated proteobacterium Delta 3]|nr:hypothetical protein D3OALGA1CA_3442 [Olavius algarvensis associated proteobacterium Delta 3]CAB5162562.1 hypothetical protein D3OALGB2SA_5522 [Olavius algarvensis associated proteobacterium Delta 3]
MLAEDRLVFPKRSKLNEAIAKGLSHPVNWMPDAISLRRPHPEWQHTRYFQKTRRDILLTW